MKKKEVAFDAIIQKFGKQGEKSGWRYIEISIVIAQQLYPDNKKSFRVSGKIDQHPLNKSALMPMGDGSFILPLNNIIRKEIGKKEGHSVKLFLKHDSGPIPLDQDLLDCLEEDPIAKEFFFEITPGHRNYFSNWIASAKTDATKTKRIAMTLEALVNRMDYGAMIRSHKSK